MSRHGSTRRRFLSKAVMLTAWGGLLSAIGCNNKSSSPPEAKKDTGTGKKSLRSGKRSRQKWSHEGLVVNNKTNVMHLPSSKVYKYYDEIKPTHLAAIGMRSWASGLREPVHFNKQQSGKIIEILALQPLRNGITDQQLQTATDTLSLAFTKSCDNRKGENMNKKNFRLHELMLQLISLNSSVENKWLLFSQKVIKPAFLRKRQLWMSSEESFNERVKYITDRKTDYMNRLAERAGKYSFT